MYTAAKNCTVKNNGLKNPIGVNAINPIPVPSKIHFFYLI